MPPRLELLPPVLRRELLPPPVAIARELLPLLSFLLAGGIAVTSIRVRLGSLGKGGSFRAAARGARCIVKKLVAREECRLVFAA